MKKSSLAKGLAYSTAIAAAASSPANAQEPVKQYNILANRLASREVLVNWDAEKGRAYIGTGIPVMSAGDTLSIPENVKGGYDLEIYFSPEGVSSIDNKLITSKDVDNGIINGALIYRNPSTGEIEESVRLLIPVFTGNNRARLSELETQLGSLQEKYLEEARQRYVAERVATGWKTRYDEAVSDSERNEIPSGRPDLGLEMGVGNTGESFLGVSLDKTLSEKLGLSAGFFARYNVFRGNPVTETSSTTQNTRARELIGPSTYKTRVDMTTRETEGTAIGEIGAEIVKKVNDRIELFYQLNPSLLRNVGLETATSTISFERNGSSLGTPETISASKNIGPYRSWAWGSTFGTRVKLGKDKRSSIGLSLNKTGNHKSARLNFRRSFK